MARPQFQPTQDHRRTAKMLAGLGIPQEDIATFIGVSPHTLRKHFRAELDRGSIEANATVANALYKMASSGKCTAATIFWVKVRCRWREQASPDEGNTNPPEFHINLSETKS